MAVSRPPLLLGRATEIEALGRMLKSVSGGQSGALAIRGEAGLGKTALLRYCEQEARGFRVLRTAGVESEMELPFAGLHQLCAPMLARLDALPPPQRAALGVALGMSSGAVPGRFLVALAALSLLAEEAAERPLLCLVDDVQWLDAASAQVLGCVARRLHAESVAIVFAVREPSVAPDLAGLPDLRLVGLADADARALLAAVAPGRLDESVRDRLVAETHGNPLALLELSERMHVSGLAGGFALPAAADAPAQVEERYRDRIARLPVETQRLMLLAAGDPVGDAALVWRAAERFGIPVEAAEPAEAERLLEIGTHVRFHHPLVRSAVYRAASARQRQEAHAALAAATDPDSDADRRTWHRAHATQPPDEQLALDLIECASAAERRGGSAAAAAFLERAVAFTPDSAVRAARALDAAKAKFGAGDFAGSEAMLAIAGIGPLDEVARVQLEVTRARIAFNVTRRSAPALIVSAARRLEQLDADLARDTYVGAFVAAIYASPTSDVDAEAVARAARSAQLETDPEPARRQIVLGLTARFIDGYVAAAPVLSGGLRDYLGGERRLNALGIACGFVAMELWDDEAWLAIASGNVEFARATGSVALLRQALDYLAGYHFHAGSLFRADELLAEATAISSGLNLRYIPYVQLRVAALRGQVAISTGFHAQMAEGGEGAAASSADHALAVLYNGLGDYERALEPARRAVAANDLVISTWALSELVEAAARSGRADIACDAADRLSAYADASGTAWALGTAASARALVTEGAEAETLLRDAVEWLSACRMTTHLARAHLRYGEWLRRANRRVDARVELRAASELFGRIGAEGFAGRAHHELAATGVTVRRRSEDVRDELTPQEEHIARLARDGLTNHEIGARLFLSHRTVEWHLKKVFAKLGIRSRRGLADALPTRACEPAPA